MDSAKAAKAADRVVLSNGNTISTSNTKQQAAFLDQSSQDSVLYIKSPATYVCL